MTGRIEYYASSYVGVAESKGANIRMITVQRNTETLKRLHVDLSSSDTNELILPESVVIPAGESTVTFAAEAVVDFIADGDKL